MTNASPLRAMMIGAHPDDCDISTYSITARLVRAGCTVRFVSMTTGYAGHQTLRGKELAAVRARAAPASAALLGVTYEILPFDDGRLTPSLEARETLMRTIRRFQPDVIFTNRPCDYHPDHRATGQLVQDCAYLLGVPAICPDMKRPFSRSPSLTARRREPMVRFSICSKVAPPRSCSMTFLV